MRSLFNELSVSITLFETACLPANDFQLTALNDALLYDLRSFKKCGEYTRNVDWII